MQSLTSTLLTAQQGLSVLPAPKLVKTRATVYENRYVPSSVALTGISSSDPFAFAAGQGAPALYFLHGGNLKTFSLTGSPPVQGATTTIAATSDTMLAAARQSNKAAVATASSGTTLTLNFWNGSSWSASTLTPSWLAGDSPLSIACCFCPDGRIIVVVSATLRLYAFTASSSGVFTGAAANTGSSFWGNAKAITACYSGSSQPGDIIVAAAAPYTSGYSELKLQIFGDGTHTAGAWATSPGDLLSVQLGDSTNYGTVFTVGSLTVADTIRLCFLEYFQNPNAIVSYSRNWMLSFLSAANAEAAISRDPQPLPLAETTLMLMGYDGSNATLYWASYKTLYYAIEPAPVDYSSRIIAFDRHDAENQGQATILLDNADGALTALAFDPETCGDRIQLDLGYVTAAGPETSPAAPLWVTAVQLAGAGGAAVCELLCHDAWNLLASWQPRRLYFWPINSNSVLQIIQWLLARAGIPCATPGSPSAQLTRTPAWAIEPPASGAHALHALLDTVPEVLEFTSTGAVLRLPLAADSPVYSYSPTSHPILDSRITNAAQALNHVMVFGRATPTISSPSAIAAPTLLAEAIDQPDAQRFAGHAHTVTDMQLAGDTAQARADLTLRKAQMIQDAGEVATLPNVGLELWDPISLTDTAGWSSTKRRVRAINTRYRTTTDGGVFTQSVGLMYP